MDFVPPQMSKTLNHQEVHKKSTSNQTTSFGKKVSILLRFVVILMLKHKYHRVQIAMDHLTVMRQ